MIKIIRGVYGYWDAEKKRVIPKDKDSDPFILTAKKEADLVDRGIAEYVGKPSEEDAEELANILPDGVTAIPEYSTENSAAELRAIGKTVGITFKVGTSKAEMVEQLDAFFDEHIQDDGEEEAGDDDTDEEDTDDAPPKFDPAEAVQ